MRFSIMIVSMLVLLPADRVLASSGEAWEEFRAEVANACTALVEAPEGAGLEVEVNPFGSERYGAALVTVIHDANDETSDDRMICIFDKQTGAVELTAPFDPSDPN